MRETARWIFTTLLACFLVPCAWATVEVRVVDIDGTEYRVSEQPSDGDASEPTVLKYTVTSPEGSIEEGVIAPTEDPLIDRNPRLALLPGGAGPILVWTRNDGEFDQIAFSRFVANAWTDFTFMTSQAKHHLRPAMGIDGTGMGILLWAERGGPEMVMYASFDPFTGILATSPRSLWQELLRIGPPEQLPHGQAGRPDRGRSRQGGPGVTPEGGNDAPAVPPVSQEVATSPICPRSTVVIVRQRNLQIGVMENGAVVRRLHSVLPPGASEDYLGMLLTGLLQQNCP